MLTSLKKLKEFVDFDCSLEELDDTLTMLGIEVEGIIDLSKKYDKFYTAEVISCEKHPKADKLTICEVSIGSEIIGVVCGAPNVAKGQKVVLGTSGGVVPNGGFTLEKRKIRDFVSNGMICSQYELDLGEDKSGIWVLPEDTPVGVPVAKHFGIDDIVLDLGLTPNKADCLSHLGIARELSAKLGIKLKMPALAIRESDTKVDELIKVEIQDATKCPRYSARVIKNVTIKESPEWLKKHLDLIGIRPINAAVDVTNFVLFELGQPLHAFDYDKIEGKKIIVRSAIQDEEFKTLDDKDRKLEDFMLLICDEKKPVAIGGVMGGANSEITDATTNILLESAYFNPSTIRKTAKVLGLSSDSSYRFERGTDIDGVIFALNRAAALIAELCGGEIAEGFVDAYPQKVELNNVTLRFDRARKIIGIEIENSTMTSMLSSLGFEIIDEKPESVTVRVPHRRNDIFGEIDLIEEIARMYNYDNISPNYISSITFSGDGVHPTLAAPSLRNRLREYYVSNGFTEILTQNMIDTQSAAFFSENPVRIANPLGEDLSIMRPSMIPSMLKIINLNLRYGNSSLKFFEIGKVFEYSDEKSNLLPGFKETEMLAVALVGKAVPKQWASADRLWDFYDLKGIAEDMNEFFNLNCKFELLAEPKSGYSVNSMSVNVRGKALGTIGDVSTALLKKFDIDVPVFLMILNMSEIYSMDKKQAKYKPVSPFPGANRDLAFLVDSSINSGDIRKSILAFGGQFLQNVEVFDVYAGKNIEEGKKSLAFSLHFSAKDRTLVEDEVETALTAVISEIENKFSATLRKM